VLIFVASLTFSILTALTAIGLKLKSFDFFCQG
jgi:hypothetical protein